MDKRIVITGIGMISSIGSGKEVFWTNLLAGKSGMQEITSFDTSDFQSKCAYTASGFDPLEYLPKQGLHYLSRSAQMGIGCISLLLQDSGLIINEKNTFDIGLVLGSTFGCLPYARTFDCEALTDSPKYVNPLLFPNTIETMTASQMTIAHKIKGLHKTISNGETSSLDSIGLGFDLIQNNMVKGVIAGGIDEFSSELFTILYKNGLLSGSGEDGEQGRAFDKKRNGFVLGEAVGLVLLEDLQYAQNRGAPVYCEVVDYNQGYDSFKPYGTSVNMAMNMGNLLNRTGLSATDIDVICAGANGSREGDNNEAMALLDIFKLNESFRMTSIKGATGECVSASGALQCGAMAMALKKQKLPPTLHMDLCLSEQLDSHIVKTQEDIRGNTVLINNYSYLGNCTSLILKQYIDN